MKYVEILTRIGLSRREAVVYTALIEDGALSISSLSKAADMHRPALYQLMPKMIARGFVSKVKQGKRDLYVAESPERLLGLYESKQEQIRNSLGELQKKHETRVSKKPIIKTFEGRAGLENVFDDVALTLPQNGTYFRYSAKTTRSVPSFKDTKYYELRDKKKLERLAITSSEKHTNKKSKLDRHTKAIPKEFDLFDDNVSLLIYGDKTAYVDYNTNTSFVIESPVIAKFQEKLFKLLWKELG